MEKPVPSHTAPSQTSSRRDRFRLRLTILMVLAVLPGLALAIYTGFEQRRAESERARERAVLLARLAASDHAHFIENTRQILEPLAALPLIRTTNAAFWNQNFRNLQKLHPRFVNFGLIEADGRLFSSALPFDPSSDHSQHAFFLDTLHRAQFAPGAMETGFLTNSPTVSFGYPVFDGENHLIRVLFASAPLETLQDLGAQSEIPDQATLHVLDRNGRLLCGWPANHRTFVPKLSFHSDNEEKTQGTLELLDPDGIQRLYAFTSIQAGVKSPFIAAVGIPKSVIYATANRTLVRNLLFLLLAALFAWALAHWYSRRYVLTPLSALTQAARQLADGNLDARAGLKQSAEFQELADTFDCMANKMQTAVLNLEAANRELSGTEAKFRHLVEQSLAGIYIIQDDRFVYVNPKLEEIFDFSASELTARPLLDFIAPADRAKVGENVRRRVSGEIQSVHYQLHILRRDGRHVLVEVHGARSEYKQRPAVLGMLVDITERQRAEEALHRERTMLRTLIDLLPDAIYVKDRDSRFVLANMACARLLNAPSPQDLIGKTDEDFHGPDRARGRRAEELDVLNGNPVLEKDEVLTRADGTDQVFLTTKIPLRDSEGKVIGLIGSGRDITERRAAAEAIRKLNAELVERVKERTAKLQAANAQLAQSSKLKDEFLANMSHELRTPLNAILGLSESLLEEVGGPLTPRQVKAVTTISNSGSHLLALINDILDLSKIEAGKMELNLASIQLDDFCASCLSFVKTQAMQKRVSVSLRNEDRIVSIQADPKRLKQALVNLLNNAVKFTPEGGSIGLTISAPPNESVVRFCVWDTGIGIASTDAALLFRAFSQIDSGLNRAQEGTGLGLALVAKLVELHGGSVSLESEPGKGSRFILTFPRLGAPPAPARKAPVADHSAFRRALLIEDDPIAREQIERYLAELGVATVIHARGDDSLEVALREQPDFILLDILLPGESGWVVLARLKEHPATRDLPVAVISVLDEPEKSSARGASSHLTKPISREQLAHFLQRPAIPSPGGSHPASGSSRATILLAEDNLANVQTIGDYLSAKGYDVRHAANGRIAVDLARECHPGCILMDIQMPVMDGLTAIQEIRADPNFDHVPILALTALAMPGDRERCLAAGATDYMSKPVSLRTLSDLIPRLLPKN